MGKYTMKIETILQANLCKKGSCFKIHHVIGDVIYECCDGIQRNENMVYLNFGWKPQRIIFPLENTLANIK